MTFVRIQVTADDVAEAERSVDASDGAYRTDPIEVALARIAGVGCDVSGDPDGGYVAAIGNESPRSLVLVANLPPEATAYLDRWWDTDSIPEPTEFRLELDDWLVDLFRTAE